VRASVRWFSPHLIRLIDKMDIAMLSSSATLLAKQLTCTVFNIYFSCIESILKFFLKCKQTFSLNYFTPYVWSWKLDEEHVAVEQLNRSWFYIEWMSLKNIKYRRKRRKLKNMWIFFSQLLYNHHEEEWERNSFCSNMGCRYIEEQPNVFDECLKSY
jgi:hypothetical protein